MRMHGTLEQKPLLSPWPIERPADWIEWVNTPITAKELKRLTTALERGQPFGSHRWVLRTAEKLKLEHRLRPEGRPTRQPEKEEEKLGN